jgi:triphosphoribosyl-dephospho-CoA synthase
MFEPRVALASLSGESDADWARSVADHVGCAFLGGIAIDDATRRAARRMTDRDRKEFLPRDPVRFIEEQLRALEGAPLRPAINVRSRTLDPIREVATACDSHGAILEINAHCRQDEMCRAGAGQALLGAPDRLVQQVRTAASQGAEISVKVRTEVDGVDLASLAAQLDRAGADAVHVDAMDSEHVVADVVAATDCFVIGNNGVCDRETTWEYLEYGADAVSVGRASDDPAVLAAVRQATEDYRAEAHPRSAAENAELALLLEVAGTPKPGNVDRHREYEDLRLEHFLAGAVGARDGFRMAASGDPVGEAFERAIAGMADQSGGNTQFGAVLLLTPLVRAAARHTLGPDDARAVVEETTVEDTAGFYRAFDHVDVAVADPPADMADLDVRRGSDAVPTVEERGISLGELMRHSADRDGVAAEWAAGFPRTFDAADSLLATEGPIGDRTARVYLEALAAEPDTFVAIQHDRETAAWVQDRARAALDGEEEAEYLAEELVDREINPGTTADVVAGALFVALERGLEV